MSASASKKKRKGEELTGTTPKQLALKKEKEKKKKTIKTVCISVGAVLVAAAIVTATVLFVSRPSYDVNEPVATVGDYQVTVPMFNYFYADSVNTFTSQYGSFLSYFLDTSKSLDSQYEDEANGVTWGDYFETQAESSIKMYYNIYDYALKDGYTLTDDDNAAIDETISSLETSAKNYKVSANKYLEAVYGEGCTLESYREYCTIRQVVASYYKVAEPLFESTEEEVNKKYDDDPDAVDEVTYLTYAYKASDFMPKPETDDAGETTETTAAAETTTAEITDDARKLAKAAADEAVTTYPVDDATSATNNGTSVASSISEDAKTWLFASDRKDGDTKVFASEDNNTYTVLQYKSRDTHEYNLVNAYVINIPFDTDTTAAEDDSTEEKKTDKERYDAVLAGLKGDMTDDDFSTLGTTYGTSYSGITNNIKKGAYADDIDAWLFSSARKAGDTKAFVEDNNYYIIRYSETHEDTYKYELAEGLLHDEKYNAWYEKVSTTLTVTMNEGLRKYINSDIMLSSSSDSTTAG